MPVPTGDERRGAVLADRERRLARVVVEVVPEDVVVDDHVVFSAAGTSRESSAFGTIPTALL